MTEIKLNPDKIAEFLSEQLQDKTKIFIFPTDTSMNSWIEFLITHPQVSKVEALPLERFTAWDNFKRKYLKGQKEDFQSVPSILRKLFVQDLIVKNAALPQNQRLQSVIKSEDKYAFSAVSFADWISKNLPSLHFWKKRLEQNPDYGDFDNEDKDYLKIYKAYEEFLNQNHLFEPSWLDNLNMEDSAFSFVFFYPELLEDFQDFIDLLKDKKNVTLITLPENLEKASVYVYPDSRSELRQTMLQIIELVNENKADWSEIALSVPDIDTYRPYLEREFQLYEIPYVIKAGVSLTKNSAGRIFREIYNCYNENFTFDSVRALILDDCVPWKEEHAEKREALVRVGNEMRCVCSPGEKDVWLSAFQSKINKVKDNQQQYDYYNGLKEFYGKIKHHVEEFFEDNTFAAINKAWQDFKIFFLEGDSQFSENANNILGRCISELKEIIQIEENYADCKLQISSSFDFFLNELDGKKYSPQQQNKSGVNIFPYKLSGPACFKYQFVIDASQKNLEIPYKRLTFLNATKRGKLHLIEEDKGLHASEAFIQLYAKNYNAEVSHNVVFSAAESTFSGFAIPHSALNVVKEKTADGKEVPFHPDLNDKDYILNERKYILCGENKPEKLTESQKVHYENWSRTNSQQEQKTYFVNQTIRDNLKTVLIEKRTGNDIEDKPVKDTKIKITARADMEKFFPCPRKWLLSSVLKLQNDTLDTSLMQSFDMGNLNHKILELFVSQFQGKTLPYYDEKQNCFMLKDNKPGEINSAAIEYKLDLLPFVEKAIFTQKFSDSPLVTQSLKDQKEKLAEVITDFLKCLLLPFGLKEGNNQSNDKIAGIGNCTVMGCEKSLCAQTDKFDYYGKIDCLLMTPENDWIIVDYKNSKIPGAKDTNVDENELLKDFQMAVYCKLINEENKHEIAAGIFYSISKKDFFSPIDIFKKEKVKGPDGKPLNPASYRQNKTFQDYMPSMKAMEEYAATFAEISNPEQEVLDFTPYTSSSEKDRLNVKSYENCLNCTFKAICRTTYNIGKKEIAKSRHEEMGAN